MPPPDDPHFPYAYVPGSGLPHPTSSPEGPSFGLSHATVEPILADDWASSPSYRQGIALFNAGYYWEAHEAWERLWHAQGRAGATAEILKGLIKLAAAGVKVRQGQRHGVETHATRAAACFAKALTEGGRWQLGLDLEQWIARAKAIAAGPPEFQESGTGPIRVFDFLIEPAS